MGKAEEFLSMFAALSKVLSTVHQAEIREYNNFDRFLDDLKVEIKCYRALFAEGLFLFAHTSLSDHGLAGARAQLSQIAGENIKNLKCKRPC